MNHNRWEPEVNGTVTQLGLSPQVPCLDSSTVAACLLESESELIRIWTFRGVVELNLSCAQGALQGFQDHVTVLWTDHAEGKGVALEKFTRGSIDYGEVLQGLVVQEDPHLLAEPMGHVLGRHHDGHVG